MMNRKQLASKRHLRNGFSLVEVSIAMAVVAIMLTSFVAVFGPAQRNITRSLNEKNLSRLSDGFEYELSVLRSGEEEEFSTAFDKAFEIIRDYSTDLGGGAQCVILYEYKGSLSVAPRSREENAALSPALDGSLVPFVVDSSNRDRSVSGRDFTMQTAVRIVGNGQDTEIAEELNLTSIGEGSVYLVRMRQLVDNGGGELTLGNYGEIINPPSLDPDDTAAGQTVTSADQYTGSYIAFQAEFFKLKSSAFNYIVNGNWDIEDLGKPFVTKNLAVRR